MAQETTIYVWQNLFRFEGDAKSFFAWLNRLCFTKGAKAINTGLQTKVERVELTVPDSFGGVTDNPELYSWDTRPSYRRALPEFITGVNLKICNWIRSGYDYAEIAEILEITEMAVKKRVAAMRNKIQEMKEVGVVA